MTAPIDIANRALAQIRAGKTIARFDENSVEANACGRFYEVARDAALASYDWAFARRYVALAMIPEATPARWHFAYRYPVDCLKVRAVRSGSAMPHLFRDLGRHEVASDAAGQIILTNTPRAVLEYTARIENPDQWGAPFQQLVVFLLASYIGIPITGNQQLASTNQQFYQQQLEAAKLHSAQQNKLGRDHVRSAVEARW